MSNALNYVSLARKAGRLELGEEPVGAAARADRARLVIVASDAGDHTQRRAKSFVSGTGQQCVIIPYTKEELGMAVGRTSLAMAAFTDAPLALNFLQTLGQPERYAAAIEDLQVRSQRVRKHQLEAKAHQRNVRRGKVKKHE